jgi:type IV pilus assembly protein PilM
VFTRVVASGTESMATELAERRQLTLEHARQWLEHVGLLTPIDDVEGDVEIVREARGVLSDGVRRIADEVRNSLDYYVMQEGAVPVERAALTGLAVAVPGFSDQLGGSLSLPLEVRVVDQGLAGGLGGTQAGQLSVAAGLTVDEVGT